MPLSIWNRWRIQKQPKKSAVTIKAENAALLQADNKEEDLPEGLLGTIKLSYKKTDATLTHLIGKEYKAQLWNITSEGLTRH